MSKRRKKNNIILIFLFMALVLLVGFYVWYSNNKKTKESNLNNTEDNNDVKTMTLATIDPSKLKYLHLINAEVDIELIIEGEEWKDKSDPNRPINQTHVKTMINLIDSIISTRIINDNPDDIAEYGLDKPAVMVNARGSEGETITLRLGNAAVGANGSYAQVNEDKKVYLLSSSYTSGFNYTDVDMTAVEAGPDINSDEIFHVDIVNRDDEDFELLYDTKNEYDYSKTGMFSWIILKPYSKPYAAAGEKVTEQLGNYTKFKYISCVDYSSNDLSLYGLTAPMATISVDYYKTTTIILDEPEQDPETGKEITEKTHIDELNYKIHIGNLKDGYYYVMKEGSNAVYTMKAEDVDSMLQIDYFNMISPYIAIPNIVSVDKIIAELEGTTYTMEIKRSTSTNEENEEETINTYYYNGKSVTEEDFKDVYQVLISSRYDAKINPDIGIDTDTIKPYLTLSFYLNDEEGTVLTTSYLPYDESFYLIQNEKEDNRLNYFAADKRKIEEIAASIKDFVGVAY